MGRLSGHDAATIGARDLPTAFHKRRACRDLTAIGVVVGVFLATSRPRAPLPAIVKACWGRYEMSISSVGTGSYSPYQRPTFDSSDTNDDGALSLDEFGAIGKNVPGGKNGLGSNDIQNLFSAIDSDGDGSITKTEAKSAYDKLSSAVQSQLLGVQEQSGQQSFLGGIFADADTDSSGALSLDEFKAAAQGGGQDAQAPTDSDLKNIFNSIDANKDGSISPGELKAAAKHGHHHHGPPPATASTDSQTPDQAATDPLLAALSSSDPSSAQQGADKVNGLFLQAVSAYTDPVGSASNVVGRLLDALKEA